MKRDHVEDFGSLYFFYPLFFWYQCHICEQEFRREKGWKAYGLPARNNKWTKYYLCNSCAPTRKIANEYFVSEYLEKFRLSAPPPPSPPASKIRRDGRQPK